MQKKLTMRTVFWSITSFLFLFNIVGVILFKNNFRLSPNTLIATLFFIATLIRGAIGFSTKNRWFLYGFYKRRRFYRYNQPINQQLHDFYLYATVYFSAIPFYLPLAAFSERTVHTLWSLALFYVPQLVLAGFEMRKAMIERKKKKTKEELLKKEKKEQEKREEMGYWK